VRRATAMSSLLYVYAILPADAPVVPALRRGAVHGIDGGIVTCVEAAGLAAAVSAVAPSAFEAEPLNLLVRDMDWLAPRAAAHQQVNALLLDQTDALIPLTFGTVYRTAARIVAMLETEREALTSCLERVRGKAEWVLSLQRQTEEALAALERQSDALREVRARIATGAPGRAYLLSRQLETIRQRELLSMDGRAVAALDDLLPTVGETFPERVGAGPEPGPLARLSVLVGRPHESGLLAAVAGYRQHWSGLGYDLRLTGPWPPYRFSTRGAELLSAGR
jgi:hypothetical protein